MAIQPSSIEVDLLEGISDKMSQMLEIYKKKVREETDQLMREGIALVNRKFEAALKIRTPDRPSGIKQPVEGATAGSYSSPQQKQDEVTKFEDFSPSLTSSPKRQQQRGSGRPRGGGGSSTRNPFRRPPSQYRSSRPQFPVPTIEELMVTDEWAEEEEQRAAQPRQPRAPQPVLTVNQVLDQLPQ